MVCGEVPLAAIQEVGDLQLRRDAEKFQLANNQLGYGRVSFIQEVGCKLKVVCVPSFWVQAYFQPVHETLESRIRYIETGGLHGAGVSCVFNQTRGAYFLQRCLEEKRDLASIDLSAATDRFPLEP